jgi:hypothetical protein
MTDLAETAKQVVDLARRNIENQQDRIARQRELLGSTSATTTSRGCRGRALSWSGCRSSLNK